MLSLPTWGQKFEPGNVLLGLQYGCWGEAGAGLWPLQDHRTGEERSPFSSLGTGAGGRALGHCACGAH